MALASSVLVGQTTYYPDGDPVRANGMDLDRDFVVGETGVDDLACDEQGESTVSNVSAENLDGSIDAALEGQIYVALGGGSEGTGTDNTSCGTPGSPCATIDYAVTTRYAAVAASVDNVFICANGTQTVQFALDAAWDGEAGTVTQTAASVSSSSNQRYDHEYPSNPLVIMAWDTDNDNEYYPADTDDEFVIDTGGNGIQCTPGTCPGKLEIAHAKFENNGNTSSTGGGWIVQNSGTMCSGCGEHWYFHDLHVFDVNDQQCQHSGNVVFSFQDNLQHLVIKNNYISMGGGYLWRGGKQGQYHLYAFNYIEMSAIGGASTNVDNNGASCSGAGGSEKTGANIMRTWYSGTGDAFYEYVDNSIVVDKTVGTNGYTNGYNASGEIVGGVILAGWREWNWSGNYLQDIRGAIPTWQFDEGISIQQTANDHYRNNNTSVVTHADAFVDSVIFGMTGGNGTTTGSGGIRDEMSGVMEVNDNCVDWTTATADVAQGINWAATELNISDALVLRIENNALAANWNGSRAIIWVDANADCTNCIPAEFHFSGNEFRNSAGVQDDPMFKAQNHDWSSAWDSGNGNNTYYGSEWVNNGTTYNTLSAWQAVVDDAGSSEDTQGTVSCSDLSDGTDYSTGGGGGGSPSINKYFPFVGSGD